MVATTSGEDDDTPKPDHEDNDAPKPKQDGSGPTITDLVTMSSANYLASLADDSSWIRMRELVRHLSPPQVRQRVGRDQIVNVNVGTNADVQLETHRPGSLAERRQEFHFEYLKHAMKQAEWMFLLSVCAMTAGVVAMLVGGVLALAHAGSSNHGYASLVTGLSGAFFTTGGGVLARHSKRTMANLTEAAKRNEDKIDADHQLETATTFIDRVQDKDAKDRLNSAAALKALNIQPNPDTMLNRLLPGDQPKEIEPGDSAT